MRAYVSARSTKLIFLLLFLAGALSVSAVTLAGSVFTPIGTVSEGSVFASLVSSFFGPSNTTASSTVPRTSDEPATVRTNKAHYSPGDTAKITGENFGPNETVTLQVTHTDGTPNTGAGHEPWTATTDGSGLFITTWYVDPDDSLDSTFLLTAVSTTASASTNFSDPGPSADLDQCRNGAALDPNDCIGDGSGGSGWVNGNVGAQQGHFVEGYSIPYRMRLDDVTAGTWTLDIGYDTVHSSRHAIDFLTRYDRINDPAHTFVFGHARECIDPSDFWIGGAANEDNCPPEPGVAATDTHDIPKPILPASVAGNPPGTPPCTEPYSGGVVLPGAVSCPDTEFERIADAGDAYMSMWNGSIDSISYVSQNVVSGQGQQHTRVRIVFTVTAQQAAADNGQVLLAWGGHIGRAQDWGTLNSAGGISGSPYHMNLEGLCAGATPAGQLCADGGSQDRSLSAQAVSRPGTIVINKNIQAGDIDGTFGYTTTGDGLSNFNLTTVGGTATTSFTGLNAGTRTVNESTIPNTHLFVSLVCVDPDNGTTTNGTTATIDLDEGETVTCTYTNRQNRNVTDGRIIVVKDTVPNDTTDFTFTTGGYTSVVEGNPFTLKDGESNDSCGAGNDNCLEPGTYSVAETPNNNYETTSSCSDGSPVNAISVQAGETVTCTFVNRKKPDVAVTKVADAASVSAGTAIGFTLTVTNLGPNDAQGVTLTDTLPTNSGLNWSIDGGTGAADCSIAAGVLTCNFGTLASGATRTVHITSPTTAATCGVVNNTGTVSATNEIPGATANNSASASVTVSCPDIRVQKTAANSPINAGDVASFTITISNIGTGSATGVTLNDPLPAGVAWAITGGTGAASCVDPIVGNTLSCNFGTMAPGASFTVIVSGATDAADCGTLTNTATGAATNEGSDVLGNNSATANIVVNCPDVSVVKSGNGPINAGTNAVFTITVTSIGPGTANGVTLSDTLPAGIAWSEDSTSCSIAGLLLTCNFGDLAAGQVRVVTVTGLTDAADCGTLNNTVNISATNEPATVLENNTSSASINVLCAVIIVQKVTFPGGDPTAFEFDTSYSANFMLSDGQSNNSGPLAPGAGYSVAELVPTGWDVDNVLCSDNSPRNNINLSGGETVTCVFTNTKRGRVDLTKTFQGQPLTDPNVSFQFQIRQDASTTVGTGQGTTLSEEFANSTNGGNVDFATLATSNKNGVIEAGEVELLLVPGTYQICEYIQVGWDSTIRDMLGAFVPEGAGDPQTIDNSFVCAPFTITPGESEAISIDNVPPPGGMAKTIGFWKNHASCKASNGKQDPVLDQVLATFPIALNQTTHGVYIGNYYVDTCLEATALLDKRLYSATKKGGDKAASDPAYNMAAQLMAAKLNLQAGAENPFCLNDIVAEADALLAVVNFNGSTIPNYGSGATGAARKARMNYLAGLLDAYNNNELDCGDYVPLP